MGKLSSAIGNVIATNREWNGPKCRECGSNRWIFIREMARGAVKVECVKCSNEDYVSQSSLS